MKIILKIAIMLTLLPIQLHATIPNDIRSSIEKSKIDLLKKALKNHELTTQQKNECLKFANEISDIREYKMKIGIIKPTKKTDTNGPLLRIAGFLGFVLAINGGGYILNETTKFEDLGKLLGDITAFCVFEATVIYISKKLWDYGATLNTQFSAKYRSPKQKYLDSLEIKSMLST